jgi:Family of unknown function (DUF6401)
MRDVSLGKFSDMSGDLSGMSLWLAGEAGQVSLARSAGQPGMRASVDQHAAEIRDALGGRLTVGTLLSYAQGFTEAAVARGWWPRGSERAERQAGLDWELGAERAAGLDWESLRLAAVCRLVLEVRGLGV